ncbi:MAG TPA: sulfite exporter TauE/SafE family protein [Steroidobacteraceae bacterium]|nr:sulfite exporter TauE/SafE family protein [Steroidobacteraceae bacterium]
MLSIIPSGFSPGALLALVVILGMSALMSGLSGFGFSAIGALCLWLLPPKLGVPLLMGLSAANQLLSIGQLKADMKPLREWWPHGPGPYLLGGLLGVPIGLALLHSLPTSTLMAIFGTFLVLYAVYSILKPESLHVSVRGAWPASSLVGALGGVIGGFTAFPGAAVIVWCGLRRLPKSESRAIVQPYILGLQLVAIALLAIKHPETFDRTYGTLLLITLPVVLPGTLLGVYLYRSLSEVNFRRIAYVLLGTSGVGLLAKAAGAVAMLATAAGAAATLKPP